MNWRKAICWLKDHKWEVLEGKRYCVTCGHKPKNDVKFCPECGSERLRLCIWVSSGYQFLECRKCGHKFQDTGDSAVTVTHDDGCYELEKPVVDQDGEPIGDDEQ